MGKLTTYKATVDRIRSEKKELIGQAVRTAEVNAAAFALGLVNGKSGGSPKIFGGPLELWVGVAGHVAGFWLGGKTAEHLHNLSDGALACWTYAEGLGAGAAWAKKK